MQLFQFASTVWLLHFPEHSRVSAISRSVYLFHYQEHSCVSTIPRSACLLLFTKQASAISRSVCLLHFPEHSWVSAVSPSVWLLYFSEYSHVSAIYLSLELLVCVHCIRKAGQTPRRWRSWPWSLCHLGFPYIVHWVQIVPSEVYRDHNILLRRIHPRVQAIEIVK